MTEFVADGKRHMSATKESPFTVYAAAMIWRSRVSKNSSCPLRDHIGYVPPLFEICHLPPLSGKARTYTWNVPDSSEE